MDRFIQNSLEPSFNVISNVNNISESIEVPQEVKSIGKKINDSVSNIPMDLFAKYIGTLFILLTPIYLSSIVPIHVTTLIGIGILFWILLCILFPLRPSDDGSLSSYDELKNACDLGRLPDDVCQPIQNAYDSVQKSSQSILDSINDQL